ncbi:MAG TPA: hypothetical protein VKX17_00830, partial [Planctomycetota bacterium]|nr:hypothetical protein [Planctomycetota bacterium]
MMMVMAMMRPQQFHNVIEIMIGGRFCQARRREWKSLVTSYPPGWIEMFESEAARGDGFAVGPEGKMIAAVAVGKWESRG